MRMGCIPPSDLACTIALDFRYWRHGAPRMSVLLLTEALLGLSQSRCPYCKYFESRSTTMGTLSWFLAGVAWFMLAKLTH
jgi:hypothetical protein